MKSTERAPRMRTESNWLRYTFTEEEIANFSRKLAEETQLLESAEAEKKVAVAQFSERIARHKGTSSGAARNICMGYEMRMVECDVILDTPTVGAARVIRKDTGEVVKERAMSSEEMQLELELGRAATKGKT